MCSGTGNLTGRIAQAVMSIQAIKGVEIGLGFEMAKNFGSDVMDEIIYFKTACKGKSPKVCSCIC